ncbi:MAG: decaprenyl-phosphate phosphoribosyltransferase, partial [Chloroflexota bacterium]|nr:decaprenyl-phosphate phosphoribosyltransferase [Chloroflexota bacterium]
KQWIKNTFIFTALVFDEKLFRPWLLAKTCAAFVLFCLVSSAVYIINDLADMEEDRRHPGKRLRPLPSGELSPVVAKVAAVLLVGVSVPLSFLLSLPFGLITLGYFLLMIAYSFVLKKIVIVDVLTVAAGFLLRVGAGVVIVVVERFSPWLYICALLLALFLALGKRRHELLFLGEGARQHRSILSEYNLRLLDDMIVIVLSATLVSYSLYTFSAPNLPENHAMMLTIPLVLYGLFRYLYLIRIREEGGAPEELVLNDGPLVGCVLLWGLTVVAVLYL